MYEAVFIHHRPPLRNIGDELCSPRHYFRFVASERPVTVMGGGVFQDLGEKALSRLGLAPTQVVLWGVGRSNKRAASRLIPINDLPYPAWGLRDRDGVTDEAHFLPCVSCLHPMLDLPIAGDGTLLFVNADPRVTRPHDTRALQRLAKAKGWQFLQNSCSDEDMAAALQSNRRVITNSFHGAYWSLLSSHEVQVVGYSSKFESLLSTLGANAHQMLRYQKPRKYALRRWLARLSQAGSLVHQIQRCATADQWIRLDDAKAVRGRFRLINLRFAEKLTSAQLFKRVELIQPVDC